MSYYGDCRDLHYHKEPGDSEFCIHSVHGKKICSMGHVKCPGPKNCINRFDKEGFPHTGRCPYKRRSCKQQ